MHKNVFIIKEKAFKHVIQHSACYFTLTIDIINFHDFLALLYEFLLNNLFHFFIVLCLSEPLIHGQSAHLQV